MNNSTNVKNYIYLRVGHNSLNENCNVNNSIYSILMFLTCI